MRMDYGGNVLKFEINFDNATIRTASNGEQFYEITEEIKIGTGKGLLHFVVPKRYGDIDSDTCKKFVFEVSESSRNWSIFS